jgi:hypothetical protein
MRRGDFSVDWRLGYLLPMSVVIGVASAFLARLLVDLINFFTNLFFFGHISLAATTPASHHLGAWVILQ